MRIALLTASLLAAGVTVAATPINGWYTSLFGGYNYLPNNINTALRTNADYHAGFDAGGSIGYKSNPMRYEGELTYLDANLNKFKISGVDQTGVGGHSEAVLAMANIYYDFKGISAPIQPFIGGGIGYAWVNAKLYGTGPLASTAYTGSNNIFAYQATAGLTYNFAENYALNLGYRYVATTNADNLGKSFQANLANLGAIYRFDEARYK
jgi:opacity protein-like surface antigen